MASTVEQIPINVSKALKFASKKTGISFDYLLRTARRESNLNPAAKAPSSSATGLFQFLEQTWLETVRENGPAHGLEKLATQITKDSKGRYRVENEGVRQHILGLRKDPKISALLAGAHSQKNAHILTNEFHRTPSAGDLYLAHFLGSNGAVRFLKHLTAAPTQLADKLFPQAAKANPSIFKKNGKAQTIAQVYQALTKHHGGQTATTKAPVTPQQQDRSEAMLALNPSIVSAGRQSKASSIISQPGQIAQTRYFELDVQPAEGRFAVKKHVEAYDQMFLMTTRRQNSSQLIEHVGSIRETNKKVLLQSRPRVRHLFGRQ